MSWREPSLFPRLLPIERPEEIKFREIKVSFRVGEAGGKEDRMKNTHSRWDTRAHTGAPAKQPPGIDL